MGWEDIKLYQYKQIIEEIQRDDLDDNLDKALHFCAILFEDVDFSLEMPYKNLVIYYNQLSFLKKVPKILKNPKSFYQLKDHQYLFNYDLSAITTAQYIDWSNYAKLPTIENLEKLLSVILVPVGHSYNDGYDISVVMNDINDNLSIVDALSLSNFFQRYLNKFMTISLYYSNKQLKKLKKDNQKKLKN